MFGRNRMNFVCSCIRYRNVFQVRFLYIAYGSVCELEIQTMLCGDLGYIGKERFHKLTEEIGAVERMLKALIKSLENKHWAP